MYNKIIFKLILEEFYNQGDFEKKLGLTPLPLMDREKVSLFQKIKYILCLLL